MVKYEPKVIKIEVLRIEHLSVLVGFGGVCGIIYRSRHFRGCLARISVVLGPKYSAIFAGLVSICRMRDTNDVSSYHKYVIALDIARKMSLGLK